jgi:hypothetical protein
MRVTDILSGAFIKIMDVGGQYFAFRLRTWVRDNLCSISVYVIEFGRVRCKEKLEPVLNELTTRADNWYI